MESSKPNESQGKDKQLKHDLLHVALIDIYMNLKKMVKNFNKNSLNLTNEKSPKDPAEEEKEQKRLLRLGNLVLVDYVRSMIDLLIHYMEESQQELSKVIEQNKRLRLE